MRELLLAILPLVGIPLVLLGIGALPQNRRPIAVVGITAILAAAILSWASGSSMDPLVEILEPPQGKIIVIGGIVILGIVLSYLLRLKSVAQKERDYWKNKEKEEAPEPPPITAAAILELNKIDLATLIKIAVPKNEHKLVLISGAKSALTPKELRTLAKSYDPEKEKYLVCLHGLSATAQEIAESHNIEIYTAKSLEKFCGNLSAEDRIKIIILGKKTNAKNN